MRNFGMLGKNDSFSEQAMKNASTDGLGITDKLIGSLVNSLMKNLDKQFRGMGKSNMNGMPGEIKIKVGMMPMNAQQNKKPQQKNRSHLTAAITEEQMRRMSSLPRTTPKTSIKRLSDKVIYEISAPGIQSTKDVFVSKLESGYEIKAIGDKKVYINTLPINLPIRSFTIDNNKLLVEFKDGD
jgi:hypothetical protein